MTTIIFSNRLNLNKKELIYRLKNRGRDTSNEMKKRMNLVQDEISHFLDVQACHSAGHHNLF